MLVGRLVDIVAAKADGLRRKRHEGDGGSGVPDAVEAMHLLGGEVNVAPACL
jgi:hypothetical protein